ncbi:unnamed protein product [Blepharisma stoltei]|uniref:Uncharacterized protein n=1 Tax=Blepharisma stoltei TaxID=1481888 RepID=A0AAU9JMP5_9CILI|nr:unnamed protein product [Blepharisma stoltei]
MKPSSYQSSNESHLLQQSAKLLNDKNFTQALELCNLIIHSNPNCSEAFYHKGIALSWMKKYQESIQCCHTAVSLNPKSEEAYCLLAQGLQRIKNYEAAINTYASAIELNPKKIDSYINKADCHKALEDYEGEVKCYTSAIKIYPDSENLYNYRGNALRKLKRNEEAIESYNRAIELGPAYINAHINKAATCVECENYEEAVRSYDAALNLNPNGGNIYFAKGNALQNLDMHREAINCYDAAIRIDSNIVENYLNKANSLNELGEYDSAINCFNTAIRLMPDNRIAYINRGISMNKAGKYQEAVESYNIAIDMDPNDAEVHNEKGIALMNMGALNEAIESFTTAIRLNPDYALCFCNRGRVYNELKNERAALEDFKMASELIKQDNLRQSLPKSSFDFIRKTLRNDQAKLLEKLRKLQSNAIKFEEEIQIDSSLIKGNSVFKHLVSVQVEKIKEKQAELVEKLADKINPRNASHLVSQPTKELMDELKDLKKQMEDLKNHYNEEISKLSQDKVGKNEIEVSALKVNPVILQNSYLYLYYSALYDKLHTVIAEAEVICGGSLALDSSGPGSSIISYIIGMAPMFGNVLSAAFDICINTINNNSIKNQAIKLKTATGRNPEERESAIKKTAENITINIKRKLLNISKNQEIYFWRNQGLLQRCQDFFKVNVDHNLYQNPEEILGCIDALKIIMAIMSDQIEAGLTTEEFVLQASSIPSMLKFTKEATIEVQSNSSNSSKTSKKGKKKKKKCEVFAVFGIDYKNQLLSRPEILREIGKLTGLSLTKIIDYSWKLEELGHKPLDMDLDLLSSILLSFDE